MKIKMVVFDMAGTTVDEDNVVYKTLQEAIVKHSIPVTLEEVLSHGAGKEKQNSHTKQSVARTIGDRNN